MKSLGLHRTLTRKSLSALTDETMSMRLRRTCPASVIKVPTRPRPKPAIRYREGILKVLCPLTLSGNPERNLEGRYKRILRFIGIDQSAYNAMIDEFNLIRLTRNALHGGGIYRNSRKFLCTLEGKNCILEAGKQVTLIHLMDIVEIMWKHFVIVTDGSKQSLTQSR